MILEKSLIITEFIQRAQSEFEYVLGAESSAEIIFDKGFLEQYGSAPSLDLMEKKLIIGLESRNIKPGEEKTFADLTPNYLIISSLEKKETLERKGIRENTDSKVLCFNLYNELIYRVHLENNLRGYKAKSPLYNLKFELSQQEYEGFIALPNNAVMRVKNIQILD